MCSARISPSAGDERAAPADESRPLSIALRADAASWKKKISDQSDDQDQQRHQQRLGIDPADQIRMPRHDRPLARKDQREVQDQRRIRDREEQEQQRPRVAEAERRHDAAPAGALVDRGRAAEERHRGDERERVEHQRAAIVRTLRRKTNTATPTKMNATTNETTVLMTMYGDRSGESSRSGTSTSLPPRRTR